MTQPAPTQPHPNEVEITLIPKIPPEVSEKEAERLKAASVDLILMHPFFASLFLRLQILEHAGVGTFGTDGKTLWYNPLFAQTLSFDEVKGVLCHEAMHCAMLHMYRRMEREPFKWNVACDYAINPVIEDCGMKMPKDRLRESAYDGLSAEEIFALLDDKQVEKMRQAMKGITIGGVFDAPGAHGPNSAKEQADWEVAVRQAAQSAKLQGKLPAELERFIDDLLRPQIDWKAQLRRFIQVACKNDYTWRAPNRRYVAHGLYLPTLYSEHIGTLAFAVDTSGSMGDHELQAACAELKEIAREVNPERIIVLYADAAVADLDIFESGEEIEFRPKGGGGTDFRPVFEKITEEGYEPVCLVYVTDMYGTFPDKAPEYPVMWVRTTEAEAPWGETLEIRV